MSRHAAIGDLMRTQIAWNTVLFESSHLRTRVRDGVELHWDGHIACSVSSYKQCHHTLLDATFSSCDLSRACS